MFNQILFHKCIIGNGETLNGGYVVDSDYLQIAKYLTWHFLLVFHNSWEWRYLQDVNKFGIKNDLPFHFVIIKKATLYI